MSPQYRIDWQEAGIRLLKYLAEGLSVAFAALVVPTSGKKLRWDEILMISVTAAATFAIIDAFAPSISPHARQGTGFSIGASLYQWPGQHPGFQNYGSR
jgi:hypothetical protein